MPTPARRRTAARRVPAPVPALALALVLTTACAGAGEQPDSAAPGEPRASVAPASPGADRRAPGPGAGTGEAGWPRSPVLARAVEDGPRRPTRPAAAVAQLVATHAAIADPDTPRRVLAAAGHQQQLTYRELGVRRGWDRRVRALLPRRLRRDAAANVASRREFIDLQGDYRSDELPAWRIARPQPARVLLDHYRDAERRFGVDWEYLAAINLVETRMGRIRGTSVAGAQGPMQFIPATWAQYGRGDVDDPRDAIMAAARYLDARGFGERGGVPGALYAYNNHSAYVRGVTRLAEVMQRDPRVYHGYYHWQVYYVTTRGDVLLPVGYAETEPVPVRRYLGRG